MAVSAEEIEKFRVAGAACQLVFVNGHFAAELSAIGNLPKGLEICSLERAIDCGMAGSCMATLRKAARRGD